MLKRKERSIKTVRRKKDDKRQKIRLRRGEISLISVFIPIPPTTFNPEWRKPSNMMSSLYHFIIATLMKKLLVIYM